MNLSDLVSAVLVQASLLPEFATLLSKATLLLTIAWLIHFTLARGNPRWRVLLWRGVAVGLVMSLGSILGLLRFDIRVPASSSGASAGMSVSSLPLISDEQPRISVLPAETFSTTEMPATPNDGLSVKEQEPNRSIASAGGSHWWPAADAEVWGLIVWGLGVMLLFLRLVIGQLRLRHLLHAARPAPEHVVAEARQISAKLGCQRTVAVRSSQRCAVPFLSGVLRPIITLPDRMCEPTFQRDLPAVLAHELAHVRSSDVAWNIAIHATSILLWFHPLVWRIGAAHRAACDAVCDAVSALLLGDVQAYCRTLAKVALDACSFGHASALAMAQSCDVRRRVVMLQRNVSRLPLRRRAIVVMGLFGLLSVSLLAGVRLTAAQPATKDIADSPVASATENEEVKPKLRSMTIRVVDPERKPIANARVTVRAMVDVFNGPVRYRTNAEGIAQIKVPDHERLDLQLLVWAEHRVTVGASWRHTAVQKSIPSEITFEMEPGTSFGGIIRDEQEQPIAGAKVAVSGRKQSSDGVLWFSIHDSPTTDENGRWQSNRIPADLTGYEVKIKARHPNFAVTPAVDYKTLSLAELRNHSASLVMHTGLTVEGTITDPQGRPVAGAMVGQYVKRHSDAPRTTTDENGHYRLPPCDPGEYVLAVAADGFAPNSRRVNITSDQRSFDLQLQRGESIRLRIVDQDGKPVAGAVIATGLDREILLLDNTRGALPGNDRNLTTDAEGRWSRLWIPEDYLTFYIRKDGYGSVQKSFKPDEQEQIVTLQAGNWSVSGRVVDRETKAPVTKFSVVEGYEYGSGKNDRSWRERLLIEDKNGQYRAIWSSSGDSHRVIRIEAEGYLPSQAQPLKPDEMEVVHNFELEKGSVIAGVILMPDGKPISGADVTLCTPTRGLYLRKSEPLRGQNSLIVRTGADGRFSFASPGEKFALIVVHEQGFARVDDDTDAKEIILQPWARVEGTFQIHNAPAPNETLTLGYDEPRRDSNTPRVHYDYRTTTDEQGHFAFEKVAPGSGQIVRRVVVDMGRGMTQLIPTHVTKTTFVAGETIKVQVGRSGRPVVGKLKMPDGRSDYDWRHAMASLQVVISPKVKPPQIPMPKDIDPQKDREAAMKWWEEWKDTKEGKQFSKEAKRYNAAVRALSTVRPASISTNIEPTGAFTFDDLPAGDYHLTVHAQAEPKGDLHHPGQPVASLSHTFKIPEIPRGRSEESLDLGTLTLKAIQHPSAPE